MAKTMSSLAASSLALQFFGLRREVLLRESTPPSGLFLRNVRSQLHLPLAPRTLRAVVAMERTRKFFVGGNWKCNGTRDSIRKLVTDLNDAKLENDVDVVVAPPYIYIEQDIQSLTGRIEISALNSWIRKGGSFTGEIMSEEQLIDIGCKWVILGHSERRHIIGEGDQITGKKVAYALRQNLKVIACIGEKLGEREAGKTFEVCFQQTEAIADSISNWTDVVIAYGPVWAIGTGKVSTAQQAQEIHAAVRDRLKANVSDEVASSIE